MIWHSNIFRFTCTPAHDIKDKDNQIYIMLQFSLGLGYRTNMRNAPAYMEAMKDEEITAMSAGGKHSLIATGTI